MVPVNGLQQLLLVDVERTLVARLSQMSDLDRLFAAFVLRGDPTGFNSEEAVARAHQRLRGASRSYQDVALLGFNATLGGAAVGRDAALDSAAAWLARTNAFVDGVPTGVVDDPVALLGLALSLQRTGQSTREELRAWLSRVMTNQARFEHAYEAELHEAARRLLGLEAPPPSGSSPRPGEGAIAMAQLGLRPAVNGEDVAHALQATLSGDVAAEPRRAVLQLAVLRHARDLSQQIGLRSPDVQDLVRLLERVPDGLREWTWESRPRVRGGEARQWHVDSEYHVQNLLWAMLASVFPDICREEYTPAVGALQPRIDFGLPSLRTLIEVKFWRDGDSERKLIEEVASDASLYFGLPNRRFDRMAVFVWDNARRTETHALLRRGLLALPNIAAVVIVSRPAKMV